MSDAIPPTNSCSTAEVLTGVYNLPEHLVGDPRYGPAQKTCDRGEPVGTLLATSKLGELLDRAEARS